MSLLKGITIGSLETKNNVFLAPLAGIGDTAFRTIGRLFGAGLTFTEMVSAYGIVKNNKNTLALLRITEKERPAGIQLFGSDPLIMSQAAAAACKYPADIIDINAGCSVKKVMKTGAGANVLADPQHFYKIVRACVLASAYPVSVKIRLGVSEDSINVLENALAAQEAGACLLTLHPRTAMSKFRGRSRWEYIGLVKEHLTIPVCGNGDIRSPADAVRMIVETGCDAVMIGRAAIGNPWIVQDTIRAFKAYPEPIEPIPPVKEERIGRAMDHLGLIIALKGETRGVREAKRHLHRYLRGIPDVSRVRESLFKMKTEEEVKQKLESLL